MVEPVVRTLVYAALGLVVVIASAAWDRDPFATTSLLGLQGASAACVSLGGGVLFAVATVFLSRRMLRTRNWARALHRDLRPAVRSTSDFGIAALALASGIGEELVFRGLLVPLCGVVVSSLAFGLLHQVRGAARWAWAAWAGLTGLCLSVLFVVTGSLAGPIAAHVLINLVNLRYLRDHDAPALAESPAPPPVHARLMRRA